MKALGIIGYHHTGKTTLAVALIEALVQKGFRVSTIKDIHNEEYRADKEGSNTWKHALAGAKQVFAHGLKESALILDHAPELPEMLSLLSCDFLVIEGLKHAAVPKLLCAATIDQADELIDDTVFGLSGPLHVQYSNYKGLPVYDPHKDLPELLEAVLRHSFEILPQSDPRCCSACGKSCHQLAGDIVQGRARRSDCVQDGQNTVTLQVGGQPVSIVPFVQNLLRDSVLAFVNNLKGINTAGDIRIDIKR
ncbi:MAG TPA: molybdopterin-guanine dinucleotide biosynthesis protein B [Candidatus Syntrophosphaera sp.]|jgi:molybdopterin-guanine dinucleotide biosynthesis protein B|nr:molybdopterin-guanine dinucleotide biosynthesis protein B [Candidatus Syntrophosphaera sp.]